MGRPNFKQVNTIAGEISNNDSAGDLVRGIKNPFTRFRIGQLLVRADQLGDFSDFSSSEGINDLSRSLMGEAAQRIAQKSRPNETYIDFHRRMTSLGFIGRVFAQIKCIRSLPPRD